MLKKITLVTLFISSGFVFAESVQNDKAVIKKIEPMTIQAIMLEKAPSFKCSPFPFCVDYPEDDGSGGAVKPVLKDNALISKPK